MIAILLFLFFAILERNFAEIVKIDQGLVNGTVLHSRNGTPYQAFYAIPYAEPPVGDLRFKVGTFTLILVQVNMNIFSLKIINSTENITIRWVLHLNKCRRVF